MIPLLRILAGFVCSVFLVIQPLRANILATTAVQYQLHPQDQIILFYQASLADPCESNILNALGDSYILMQNPTMAAISYGNAMICSPGNSLMRFKYGEALLRLGFNGVQNIKDALKLEPNNPIYNAELKNITANNPTY